MAEEEAPLRHPPAADPAGLSGADAFPAVAADLAAPKLRTMECGAEAGTVPTAPASRALHSRPPHNRPPASRAAPHMGPRSRPTPGRKIRPGPVLSRRLRPAIPAEPVRAARAGRRTSRAGEVLYRLAPEDPPAMCRQPAALPRPLVQQTPRQRRRDSLVHRRPSRRTAPGPARQEAQCPRAERSTPPHPGPAPQERPPGIPRRSSQMLHGPARQGHRSQEGNRDRPMGYSPARQRHRPGPRLPHRRTIPVPVRQEPCPGLRRPGSPMPGSPVR